MKYFKVIWTHKFKDDPIVIYSEVDETRYDVRKVELFSDGTMGYADAEREVRGTGLGMAAWPPLDEIARSAEFTPFEISKAEFDDVWEKATRSQSLDRK